MSLPRQRRAMRVSIMAAVSLLSWTSAEAALSWQVTSTHAYQNPAAVFKRFLRPQESIHVVIGLKLRNSANLGKYISTQSSQIDNGLSGSPQWLSPAQVAQNYLPTQAEAGLVVAYLERNGFTGIRVSANRVLVSANGTAADVLAAFKTRLAYYTRAGHEGVVNLDNAVVPASLSNIVQAVLGLQTLDRPHVVTLQVIQMTAPMFQIPYDSAVLPATQTQVAIITEGDMSPTITDLHTFETYQKLPTINPTVVNVGGTSGDTSGQLEWDLDSQVVQSMAGGTVAGMTFYTMPGFTDADLTQDFNKAVSDDIAKVINVSLGECETIPKNDGSMAQDDSIFQLAVAQGQTFSVASGDHGAYACGTVGANGTYGTQLGDDYPASSPYVIAVGGTTLSTISGTAIYGGESGWSYSGGGPSLYEAQPSWQNDTVPGTYRGVPDVAFSGDPNSGAYIIYNGSYTAVGGTSLSSPIFVGSWARLESMPGVSTGFPASWIYTYGRSGSDPAFHDVTSGSNGAYTAGVGWDYVTGWGSWDVEGIGCKLSTALCEGPVMTEGSGALRYGFNKAIGIGSMNPATTSNGYTYQEFEDDYGPRGAGYLGSDLQLSGFSTNPGQSWLLAVGCYNGTMLGSAASYSYSSGVATWSWSASSSSGSSNETGGGFEFTGSGTTTCHIVHK